MAESTNWYDSASAALRKFFEFAAGKDLPGSGDVPIRSPFGGGGLAPAPNKTGLDWKQIFSSGSGPNEAQRVFNRDLMKKQGLRSLAVSRDNAREIREIDADMKRMREEGASAYAARRMQERAATSR